MARARTAPSAAVGGPRPAGEPPDDLAGLVTADRRHVWHPYAPMPAGVAPLPVVAADGVRLTLADGRQLIDGMSSWWAAIHGYRHPVLDAAAHDQLERMAHVMFGGLTHPAAVRLAELLVDVTPGSLPHVFFSDSGSVAVEVAIKMAIQYWSGRGRPEKHRLLTVRGGYHGDTFAAMAVCDPVTGMHHRFAGVLTEQLFAPRPEPAFGEELEAHHTAELAQLLDDHADEVAALVLEPVVQGAGGMRFYAPGYLARARALCDEHGVLLVADEIATGFGRSGELFACDHAGVAPDILCLGKALTGGYLSMAATLCSSEVVDGISAGGEGGEPGALMHGPTFMANPLAAAVATASVELLLAGPWRERVAAIEGALRAGLEPARGRPGVRDVRVLGAIGVVEADEPLGPEVQALVVEHGVWLRPFGRLLYTMPPYVIGDEDLARVTGAMVAAAGSLGGQGR